MIVSEPLDSIVGVRHAFFTRRGGVSKGVFSSLNCGMGSGDDPAMVDENRNRAAQRIGCRSHRLVSCRQIHSAIVCTVETPWDGSMAPGADAMVSRVAGIALGILTADCAPVLFADPDNRIIGAAHAGWRGAMAGVLEATVGSMVSLGADAASIVAAIGPCIHQPSYEVDMAFRAAFLEDDDGSHDLFGLSSRPGHFHFDLAAYVERRLGFLGLKETDVLPFDTGADEERFFSYRRATLSGEKKYGRGLSAIVIEE